MFDWRDFLRLAEQLSDEPTDEAAHRTAISRAYYAAYHAAAAHARRTRLLPGRHTRQRVWTAFATDPDPERALIGRLGERLRRWRVEADYHRAAPERLDQRAVSVIARARAIIEALDRPS